MEARTVIVAAVLLVVALQGSAELQGEGRPESEPQPESLDPEEHLRSGDGDPHPDCIAALHGLRDAVHNATTLRGFTDALADYEATVAAASIGHTCPWGAA